MLSFAIIMLNTDAHNPMVDNKMSVEDFVMMNAAASAGLDDGGGSQREKPAEDDGGDVEGDGRYYEEPVVEQQEPNLDNLVLPVEELHGIYERIQVRQRLLTWHGAERGGGGEGVIV
jgi:hypothetical protein